MTERMVIPGINEVSIAEVLRKLKLVENYTNLVHIDIEDGEFVNRTTFKEVEELFSIESPTNLELHLMVNKPSLYLPKDTNLVKKIIVHEECDGFNREILEEVRDKGFFVCGAVKLESGYDGLEPFLELLDCVMFMAIPLGPKGQPFDSSVLAKIKAFREKYPEMPIEIDGGINPSTILSARESGCDYFVSVSHIFKDENVEENILELEEALDYGN